MSFKIMLGDTKKVEIPWLVSQITNEQIKIHDGVSCFRETGLGVQSV